MKTKKLVGALALTAALAMGTTPAFAASVGTETEDFSDNGSTEVKAKVEKVVNPQLKATVPLQITVVFGSSGASDIMGPSKTAYTIENTGVEDIMVTNAEITGLNELFSNEAVQLVTSGTPSAGAPMPEQATNNLMFYFTTNNNNAYLTKGHSANAQTSGSVQNRYFDNGVAKAWANEELAAGDVLEIEIGGKAYFADTISQDDLTDSICSIKYTIAPLA